MEDIARLRTGSSAPSAAKTSRLPPTCTNTSSHGAPARSARSLNGTSATPLAPPAGGEDHPYPWSGPHGDADVGDRDAQGRGVAGADAMAGEQHDC
ncbi:hypothetical protein [Nonomuraea salmonea]|uniref:hypothetical protein n=1 Tax=Nonomuraea salmonea TaxID=46181 RepID=UPI003CD0545D